MARTLSLTGVCAFILLLLCIASARVVGDDKPEKKKASSPSGQADAAAQLEKLRWMQGAWHRTQGKDYVEEAWSAPEGDCMIGMFRMVKDGKLWMSEHLTITIDDGVLVFRLRHFDRKQTPWEDKDGALTYPLKSISDREVVFENPERDSPRRFVYRNPDPDTLEVLILPPEGSEKRPMQFRFQRKKSGSE